MAARDPLVLARQMAETWLARPDVVAKGAGAAPPMGQLVLRFLPVATQLCPVLDALDARVAEVGEAMDGLTAKMQRVLEQDQQRRADSAARMARLQERIGDPQQQVRFGEMDAERLAGFRDALRAGRAPQASPGSGDGEAAGG